MGNPRHVELLTSVFHSFQTRNSDSIYRLKRKNIFIAHQWQINVCYMSPFSVRAQFRRQNLSTSKIAPRTERVNIYNGRRPITYMYLNVADCLIN